MKYTETKIGRTTYKMQDFDSIHSFNEYLAAAKNNEIWGSGSHSSENGDSRFTGTSSYKEAQELFATGWGAVAAKMSKKVPVQTTNQTANHSKPTFGVVGFQASVPRYLQGIPTNMVSRKTVQQKQKIIVINRDICFSAMTSASTIEAEGIKALQIIQALEHKGFRVKLNLFFLSRRDNEAVAFRVTVKKPEERMSILKVAFPLAHPGMLRRICFKWMETHPTMVTRGYRWGYGEPSGSDIKLLLPKSEFLIPNFVYDIDKLIESMKLE